MRDDKRFDCVDVKAGIQDRLLREIAELGAAKARALRADRLANDPVLGPFLRSNEADDEQSAERQPAA